MLASAALFFFYSRCLRLYLWQSDRRWNVATLLTIAESKLLDRELDTWFTICFDAYCWCLARWPPLAWDRSRFCCSSLSSFCFRLLLFCTICHFMELFFFRAASLTNLVIAHTLKIEHVAHLFDWGLPLLNWTWLYNHCFGGRRRFTSSSCLLVLCLLLTALAKHSEDVIFFLFAKLFSVRIIHHVIVAALGWSFYGFLMRYGLPHSYSFSDNLLRRLIIFRIVFLDHVNLFLWAYEGLATLLWEGRDSTTGPTAESSLTRAESLAFIAKDGCRWWCILRLRACAILLLIIFAPYWRFAFKTALFNLNDVFAESDLFSRREIRLWAHELRV